MLRRIDGICLAFFGVFYFFFSLKAMKGRQEGGGLVPRVPKGDFPWIRAIAIPVFRYVDAEAMEGID